MNGFYGPQRFEADLRNCEVRGTIPRDLSGAFIRVGSEWDFPPRHADDSPFNEDGYISSFTFKDGVCDYKGRWIHTTRYRNNCEAGRQLYGYYRNPFTDDASIRDIDRPNLRSVANTSPLIHGGKLFAVKEDGLPYEIDPMTLATLGTWDFNGDYNSQTFTAHAKVDPLTGEMIAYGYEATGLASNDLWFYFISKDGRVERELKLKAPYVSMVHDIALTQTHIIIPVFPYVTSLERLRAGKIHWAWDASAPMYYGVLPRDGDAEDIRWFKGPRRGLVHTLNARMEGQKLILDAPIFAGNPFPFFPSLDGSAWSPEEGRAFFRRIVFDLASKNDSYTEETLFPDRSVVDLVRIDDRFLSLPYRYGYTSFNDENRPFDSTDPSLRRRLANSYGRFDLETGRIDRYFAGSTHSLQEVQFVPRPGSTAEGDGYIMGVANNFAEYRSELIIADAQDLAAGDIARIILPFRSSAQVHGKWVSSDELPLWRTEF